MNNNTRFLLQKTIWQSISIVFTPRIILSVQIVTRCLKHKLILTITNCSIMTSNFPASLVDAYIRTVITVVMTSWIFPMVTRKISLTRIIIIILNNFIYVDKYNVKCISNRYIISESPLTHVYHYLLVTRSK